MPLAPSRSTNQTQAAAVKPWLNPYQGTAVTAVAKVRANMAVVIQFRGIDSACALLKATGVMGDTSLSGQSALLFWQRINPPISSKYNTRKVKIAVRQREPCSTRGFGPAVGNRRVCLGVCPTLHCGSAGNRFPCRCNADNWLRALRLAAFA